MLRLPALMAGPTSGAPSCRLPRSLHRKCSSAPTTVCSTHWTPRAATRYGFKTRTKIHSCSALSVPVSTGRRSPPAERLSRGIKRLPVLPGDAVRSHG